MMKSLSSKAAVIIIMIVMAACNGSKNEKDKIISARENQLTGTWKYISLSGKSTQGDVLYPYGEHMFGMLMYDPGGFMSVLLMHPDRPGFASGDMMKGTPEELNAAFEGFDAYCGSYTINDENASVTHHVQGAKFPNWVGTDQIRFYTLSNDTLRITAPPILAYGTEWTLEAVLVRQ